MYFLVTLNNYFINIFRFFFLKSPYLRHAAILSNRTAATENKKYKTSLSKWLVSLHRTASLICMSAPYSVFFSSFSPLLFYIIFYNNNLIKIQLITRYRNANAAQHPRAGHMPLSAATDHLFELVMKWLLRKKKQKQLLENKIL